MFKKDLKDVLNLIPVNDTMKIIFNTEKSELNAEYKLLMKKNGPGQEGSIIAIVQQIKKNEDDEAIDPIQIGSKFNNEIRSIKYKDKLYGSDGANMDPSRKYPTDFSMSGKLREFFKLIAGGDKINLSSTMEPLFNGTFEVVLSKTLKGKIPQQAIEVKNKDGIIFELRSHRHSGCINFFEKV